MTQLATLTPNNDLALTDSPLSSMTAEQIDRIVATVDKVAEARQRMIQACLRRAEAADFVDFDGKPYLQGQGADRIASVVGIRLGEPKIDVRWIGDDCFVDVIGSVAWPLTGYQGTEIGSCNTRDKFYSGRDGESATMGKLIESANGDRKLAAEMLLGHVRKKAYSNWKARSVCAAMGIKGLGWETLGRLGFTRDGAAGKVTYTKGAAAKSNAPNESLPFVELAKVAALPVGSKVRTAGIVGKFTERQTAKGPVVDVFLGFEASETQAAVEGPKMTAWGSIPEWCKQGAMANINKLTINEYQGKPNPTINDWSEGE